MDDDVIMCIRRKYQYDVPQPDSLPQELELWKRSWTRLQQNGGTCPKTLSETLKSDRTKSFPNISYVLSSLLLIPVSAASVERSHSALKLVKTKLRSTMLNDRLNALILLEVHKDITLNYDIILNDFASKYPRRMVLLRPLTDQVEQDN